MRNKLIYIYIYIYSASISLVDATNDAEMWSRSRDVLTSRLGLGWKGLMHIPVTTLRTEPSHHQTTSKLRYDTVDNTYRPTVKFATPRKTLATRITNYTLTECTHNSNISGKKMTFLFANDAITYNKKNNLIRKKATQKQLPPPVVAYMALHSPRLRRLTSHLELGETCSKDLGG